MLQRTSQGDSVYPNRIIAKGIAREQLKYRHTTHLTPPAPPPSSPHPPSYSSPAPCAWTGWRATARRAAPRGISNVRALLFCRRSRRTFCGPLSRMFYHAQVIAIHANGLRCVTPCGSCLLASCSSSVVEHFIGNEEAGGSIPPCSTSKIYLRSIGRMSERYHETYDVRNG